MIKKTKDYDIFVFREDNRDKIDTYHLNKLIKSIQSRNLLEFRPILVNKDMEVFDGQHRLLAAKKLGVDIYYEVNETVEKSDIVILNTSKHWTIADYNNYYLKNGYVEYQKLNEFSKKNNLSLKLCLILLIGEGRDGHTKFKNGEFVFDCDIISTELDYCQDTIELIRRIKGPVLFLQSVKFWKALFRLCSNADFGYARWKINLTKQIDKLGCRVNTISYMYLLEDIYNWRNHNKISLVDRGYNE